MESMNINGADCINIKVTPVSNAEADDFLNKFSDKPLTEDPDKAKAEKEAKNKLKKIIEYFKSGSFEKDVNRKAYKTGETPRQVAQGAISKAFGIAGDVLGIATDTVDHTLHGLINLLSTILHSTVDLIMKAVKGLCRVITFNQTCCRA